MTDNKRIASLEWLRMLSMAFVVLAHYLLWGIVPHSDVMAFSNGFTLNSFAFPFLHSLGSLGVICFVLISGYFLCESRTLKFNNLLKTWAPVFFYSVLFAFIGYLRHDLSAKGLLLSFFPVGTDQYWFVTKYIALLLLAPFLSIIINSLGKKGHLWALAILTLLTVTITCGFPYGNVIFKDGPRSVATFVLLFFIAAYLKKYEMPQWIEKNCGKLFWLFILFQGSVGLVVNFMRADAGVLFGGFSSGYNALSIIPGVLLFMWFRKRPDSNTLISRAVVKLAPFSFGVYLIHDNPLVREYIWNYLIDESKYWDSPLWLLFAILVPVIFVLIGCIVDLLRAKTFSALGFDRLLAKVKRRNIEIS